MRPPQPERLSRGSKASPLTAQVPASHPDATSRQPDDSYLLCAACNAVITTPDQAVQIYGRHGRAFFNPAGIAYELRCFRNAPGVSAEGAPTSEFSWFPGCCWQIALCAACRTHLGWLFTGAESFAALISSRIKPSPSSA
ncbi:MAG: cereblon family protein [Desulfobulbus sp.]|nr:cereblon family protein [Desulfobulbus sp.]